MTIIQGAPPPPRMSFVDAPLAYVAAGLCVVALLAASLHVHMLLKESRRYRTDLRRRGRGMTSVGSWMNLEYVLDPANYQPGTAGPILRRLMKWMAVQGLAAAAAMAIALFFIL